MYSDEENVQYRRFQLPFQPSGGTPEWEYPGEKNQVKEDVDTYETLV